MDYVWGFFRYVSYWDLQFRKVPVGFFSSLGTEYTRWLDVGMPKIPEELTNCAFYLYRSVEDAESGSDFGGTGFFVGIPSKVIPNWLYVHAITNWHVAVSKGCSVIRVNTVDGKTDTFAYEPTDWHFIPFKNDIAVSPVLSLNVDKHKCAAIHVKMLITDELINDYSMGIGDDIFMVGRFVDYKGHPTNKPLVRFGNISSMPVPILQETNYNGLSYCIDLHSRTGYSGSPVFVYRAPGGNLEESFKTRKPFSDTLCFLNLLGIHWGQFPELWTIIDENELPFHEHQSFVAKGKYVKGTSGMTCVIPADRILEVLNVKCLIEERAVLEEKLAEDVRLHGFPPDAEKASL